MLFASRPRFDWHLRNRTLALGLQTRIMGILNVTPDSFSDGGHFYSPANETERALAQALLMLDAGANILDIGGESTRPNATPLSSDEEQARILPVVTAIRKERPSAILSIDTFHASTAEHVVKAGAEIINDVSGHLWDIAMSDTCAQLACGVILMHTRGTPQTWQTLPPLPKAELLPRIVIDLEERTAAATAAGIFRNRLVLDPGFGFGKLGDENYTLHAHLDAMQALKLPILVGSSRKGFLAKTIATLNQGTLPPMNARLHATTASNTAAILAGAHILRVHDVLPAMEAAAIADAILIAR